MEETKTLKPLSQVREDAYDRNMSAMRAFKESNPCSLCGNRYPHHMMHFVRPKTGWTISKLAGSRCSLEELKKKMDETPLYCAACLPAWSKPGRKRS